MPKVVDNLLVAGRNLSSDVAAQSGARLIMACFTMGEAAGTATAISLKEGIAPRKVDRVRLQAELIASGVNIGQGFRKIPGLEGHEHFEEEFHNAELWSREKLAGYKDRRMVDVPDPWNDEWKSDRATV